MNCCKNGRKGVYLNNNVKFNQLICLFQYWSIDTFEYSLGLGQNMNRRQLTHSISIHENSH